MHIAVFFLMDTVRYELGQASRSWGRVVANHDLLQSLAGADGYDRLTVFVPTVRDVKLLRETLLAEYADRVDVVPFRDMRARLADAPIDVLHTPDPNLFFGTHIRSALSESAFVVTGVTHSMANHHYLSWALTNSANGAGEFDCLICTSPTAEAVIQSIFAKLSGSQPGFQAPSTSVIPLGVQTENFSAGGDPSRDQFGLGEDDFVVLSLARFNHQVKMDMLPVMNLATMLGNENSGRRIRLVLAGSAGDGSYANYLQGWIQDHSLAGIVSLVLNPDEPQKQNLYRTADVFLSLSDNVQETFGLTIVEALAAGLPVVASDWNGYRSLVKDGETGFLIPTRTTAADPDWEAMLAFQEDMISHLFCAQTTAVDLAVARDRLLELAGNPERTANMASAAAASAGAYDWSNVVRRYVELWTELRSRQRESAEPLPAGGRRSSVMGFLSDFASYPSSELAGDDRFRTSALGTEVMNGRHKMHLYGYVDDFLHVDILAAALRFFSSEHALDEFAGQPEVAGKPPYQLAQNVLWLYKYGYVEAC